VLIKSRLQARGSARKMEERGRVGLIPMGQKLTKTNWYLAFHSRGSRPSPFFLSV
jgi:hypothetical protein